MVKGKIIEVLEWLIDLSGFILMAAAFFVPLSPLEKMMLFLIGFVLFLIFWI
jgi:type II secretory pathway component PulM